MILKLLESLVLEDSDFVNHHFSSAIMEKITEQLFKDDYPKGHRGPPKLLGADLCDPDKDEIRKSILRTLNRHLPQNEPSK